MRSMRRACAGAVAAATPSASGCRAARRGPVGFVPGASALRAATPVLTRARAQVDEQRRRAEADKLAAITELETRSREFMREKVAKMALEEKIAGLQGQLLIGGNSAQVAPAIRCALATLAVPGVPITVSLAECCGSRPILAAPGVRSRLRWRCACGCAGVLRQSCSGGARARTPRGDRGARRRRSMLEKEQSKFRSEYEARCRELERERVAIQDDKAKARHPCVCVCVCLCVCLFFLSPLCAFAARMWLHVRRSDGRHQRLAPPDTPLHTSHTRGRRVVLHRSTER